MVTFFVTFVKISLFKKERKFFSFYFCHSEQVLGPTKFPIVSKPSLLEVCTSTALNSLLIWNCTNVTNIFRICSLLLLPLPSCYWKIPVWGNSYPVLDTWRKLILCFLWRNTLRRLPRFSWAVYALCVYFNKEICWFPDHWNLEKSLFFRRRLIKTIEYFLYLEYLWQKSPVPAIL